MDRRCFGTLVLDLPGRYVVRIGERPPLDWVVRPDAGESDLNLLDDAALARLLRPTAVTLRAETPPNRPRADYVAPVIVGAVTLLAIESWLAAGYLPRRGRP